MNQGRTSLRPSEVAVAIIAKEPVPGKVKTRLIPRLNAEQAAEVAALALQDTMAAVRAVDTSRRVLVFQGDHTGLDSTGFDIVAQRGDDLGERLAHAFFDIGQPAIIVAMDTPQLSVQHLRQAQVALASDGVDAAIGPADDGGYWYIGLRSARGDEFDGVVMSVDDTGRQQLERLRALGLRVETTDELIDVDTFETAVEVARQYPHLRFSQAIAAFAAKDCP